MDIVKMYTDGMSGPEISRATGLQVWKVYAALSQAGADRRSNKINSKKYSFDEYFFDKIDNEIKAYWLGFMCADGYVTESSQGQKSFGLSLHIKDRQHIETLRADLQSTHPINEYKAKTSYGDCHYARLLITSDHAFDSLLRGGCILKKSKSLSPPDLDADLERHWLRGYFDGDGSIRLRPAAKAKYGFSILGTEDMMRWI